MPGETREMLGNTQLVEYGIKDEIETVDLRFHVGVVVKKVFVFEPKQALEAMNTGKYKNVPVYTGEIKTATGYLIPYTDIQGCKMFDIPPLLLNDAGFSDWDNTTIKGKKAEQLIRKMISRGLIPTILFTVPADDEELQLNGTDIIPKYAESIQVKCDWKAGPRELGGSGNLFIQDRECNPLKKH